MSSWILSVIRHWFVKRVDVRIGAGSQALSGLAERPTLTMCNGPAELQQATEGQRGHMWFTPAIRLLLHIFLKLDPTSRLFPAHLLVLIHYQLIELHKHLRRTRCQTDIIKHFYWIVTKVTSRQFSSLGGHLGNAPWELISRK